MHVMPRLSRLRAARLAVPAACVAALGLAGCGPSVTASIQTAALPTQSRAVITAAPADSGPVDPHEPIVVTAAGGHLSNVVVTGPDGPVKGELSADGTSWQARDRALDYGSRYRIVATAIDTRGVETTTTEQFRTVEPRDFVSAWITPAKGSTVGVGMPVTVGFDKPVKDRAAAERALVVRTSTPLEGAWSWVNDTTVQFRPKKYWPGSIDVQVEANLAGVNVGKDVFGEKNTSSTFSTGPSTVIKVDAQRHTARVVRDGEVIRTIPITTGKSGFETRSGITVIMTKERTRVMDAATGGTAEGDPEYYRLEVEYAMRITYSGEFLHAAPWSVGSQGYANVSHGCVGMSTSNAAWLFDEAQIGDVVDIRGTAVPQNLGNGITVWNVAWEDWLKDSATGEFETQPIDATVPGADPTADATAPATAGATTTDGTTSGATTSGATTSDGAVPATAPAPAAGQAPLAAG